MSAAPKPPSAHNRFTSRVRNVLLNVPAEDWARVLTGEKRMFRSYSRRLTPTLLPCPVVAWRARDGAVDGIERAVIWMEDTWQEPLGSISAADLAEEGFATISDFRRYIEVRYPKGGFRPLAVAQVYRVRPLADGDMAAWSERLLEHLYWRHL